MKTTPKKRLKFNPDKPLNPLINLLSSCKNTGAFLLLLVLTYSLVHKIADL